MAKKKSLKTLKNKLWKTFSDFIRMSHADSNGYAFCFTCGKYQEWKKLHAGHYISRVHLPTKFDEMNVKPQCVGCNSFKEGMPHVFRKNLVELYGEEEVEEMEAKSHELIKITASEYEDLIKTYQEKIRKLDVTSTKTA